MCNCDPYYIEKSYKQVTRINKMQANLKFFVIKNKSSTIKVDRLQSVLNIDQFLF